jgi:hypothetical protein
LIKGAIQFVQLGHPRSGSSLLLESIIQHPDVNIFGEVFHQNPIERLRYFRAGRSRSEWYQDGFHGGEFLRHHVFYDQDQEDHTILASGFKLFYEHARSDSAARTAWDYVINDRTIKIIHLVRRNLLECLVSLEVAKRSGEWIQRLGVEFTPALVDAFFIDVDRCHRFFDGLTCWRLWATQAFARHAVLDLCYEADLCGDFGETMERVFAFLSVEPYNACPAIVKQRRLPTQHQVTNYNELKDHFRHTAYHGFFQE